MSKSSPSNPILLRIPRTVTRRPTPIIENDRVYVHFGPYGTAALTTSGRILWKVRLPHDPEHGNGGSPALYKDLLVINCDGIDDAYIAALDKQTGEVRWKTPRRKPWGTPTRRRLVIRAGTQDQVVSVGAFRVAAYEPLIGEGTVASRVRRRLLQCPASCLCERAGLHHHRIAASVTAGDSSRRRRRCDSHTRSMASGARRSGDAFAVARR